MNSTLAVPTGCRLVQAIIIAPNGRHSAPAERLVKEPSGMGDG